MNEWYTLTNNLETEVPPLDEVSRARIEKRVRSTLPRRGKHRALAVVVAAAVLVLSACGYAVATGQFSHWFWNMAEDPQAPESSEDLLASMGTVIRQSQTVDGVTVTLDGALWDGETMMLSLSLEGENLPANYWAHVDSEDSWLDYSKEELTEKLRVSFPDMAAEELDAYLDKYLEIKKPFARADITYLFNRQTGSYGLQVENAIPSSDGDFVELTLHLENLDIGGSAIHGPFEFTFTVELHAVELIYLGDVDAEFVEGYPVRITKVALSPFQANVAFIGVEKLNLDDDGVADTAGGDLKLEALRINGQEVAGIASQHGSSRRYGPDGNWDGSVQMGPFSRVIDPASVEAIRINGTWLELSQLELTEK